MQIDFHHAVTYVCSRLAGFERAQAEVIAYASQYVDDATEQGVVTFDNGALYQRSSSAHKMLDYRNFQALADHRVWLPFHFLPGNGGSEAKADAVGAEDWIERLVCRPNSPVARAMMRRCIAKREEPYALLQLGIALHTYIDTWAHQGFVGFRHDINLASDLGSHDQKHDALCRYISDKLANYFVDAALPLGHGTVLSLPDRPYLQWHYRDYRGQLIERDNPNDFLAAADHMFQVLCGHRKGTLDDALPGLPEPDRSRLDELLRTLTDDDENARHAAWLRAIADGAFSFGKEDVQYTLTGPGSWEHLALGRIADKDEPQPIFSYSSGFLGSHWKLFNDALQAQRFDVLHVVLPSFGLCAA